MGPTNMWVQHGIISPFLLPPLSLPLPLISLSLSFLFPFSRWRQLEQRWGVGATVVARSDGGGTGATVGGGRDGSGRELLLTLTCCCFVSARGHPILQEWIIAPQEAPVAVLLETKQHCNTSFLGRYCPFVQ